MHGTLDTDEPIYAPAFFFKKTFLLNLPVYFYPLFGVGAWKVYTNIVALVAPNAYTTSYSPGIAAAGADATQ